MKKHCLTTVSTQFYRVIQSSRRFRTLYVAPEAYSRPPHTHTHASCNIHCEMHLPTGPRIQRASPTQRRAFVQKRQVCAQLLGCCTCLSVNS